MHLIDKCGSITYYITFNISMVTKLPSSEAKDYSSIT